MLGYIAKIDHMKRDRDAYIHALDTLYRVNRPEDKSLRAELRARVIELVNAVDKAYNDY